MALLTSTASDVWRFGDFELDGATGELCNSGAKVKLPLQPARVLALLCCHAGQLVTREEIRLEIWGEETVVDFDLGLNLCLNRIRAALGDDAHAPRYIETLPRRGYRFLATVERVRASPPVIAVLPFDNLSHAADGGLFGDAISDALTTELGNVKSLRVISRQSVLHLRGSLKAAPEIARELKADHIIEGSILESGGRLRITAQLVQVSPEHHLWADAYECNIGDILTTLRLVARAIAEVVEAVLAPGELERLSRPRPVDREAYISYIKGRHLMGQRSREGFERALEYLRSSLEKDPTYALAAAHLADCYASLGHWGYLPIQQASRQAKEFALKALALDRSLSTAHWAFGWATLVHDWDLASCESAAVRAIQLNPSDERAHVLYSIFLAVIREDRQRAAAEARLALDLDPLSQHVNICAAWVYLFVKDDQQAVEQALRAMELFPGSVHAYYGIGLAQLRRSKYREAIAAFEKAASISTDVLSAAYLGAAQAMAGHLELARACLQELSARREREPVPPRCFVFLYAAMGELDSAFNWLEWAYGARDTGLLFLRVMSLFDPCRSDPRFEAMVRRIGLSAD